jgi:ribosomal-protein-alanine N-acetyltransferase
LSGRAITDIRRARFADLPSILEVEKDSFDLDAWDRDLFHDYLQRPDRTVFLVAVADGSVVGYALAFHSQSRASIHSIAVMPASRGQGIAVALLRRALASLRRRGFRTVSLDVRIENKPAIELYRKFGFKRVRRINGYYEDGGPAWRMQRPG